jgi:hypothetical protein
MNKSIAALSRKIKSLATARLNALAKLSDIDNELASLRGEVSTQLGMQSATQAARNVLANATAQPQAPTVRERILAYLGENKEAMGNADTLCKALNVSYCALNTALCNLVREGKVYRPYRGLYRLADAT